MSTTVCDSQRYSVSGLVVHARGDKGAEVSRHLTALPGVEVHAVDPSGKLVVTVEEQPGTRTMIDTITAINNTAGVINTALVYTESTDDADTNDDLEEQQ